MGGGGGGRGGGGHGEDASSGLELEGKELKGSASPTPAPTRGEELLLRHAVQQSLAPAGQVPSASRSTSLPLPPPDHVCLTQKKRPAS